MVVHSICCDPANADRFYSGIAAAGTFLTEDGGDHGETLYNGLPPLYSVQAMQY